MLCRTGELDRPTSGMAPGHVQANLVVLPRDMAFDFLLFCQRNPKPCPLLEVLEPGQTEPSLAPGADVRTDLPCYRVYRNGEMVGRATAGAYGHFTAKSLAIGYVRAGLGNPGTEVEIEILGENKAATVIAPSPYDPVNKSLTS